MSSFFDSVRINVSDEMLRTAWIAYDAAGASVSMGALGMGAIKMSDGLVARITVGRTTWNELLAATGGAPPTAADLTEVAGFAPA